MQLKLTVITATISYGCSYYGCYGDIAELCITFFRENYLNILNQVHKLSDKWQFVELRDIFKLYSYFHWTIFEDIWIWILVSSKLYMKQ